MMKKREASHLARIVLAVAALITAMDVALVAFSLIGDSRILMVPPLFDLATLPLFLLALGTIMLERRKINRDDELSRLGEEKILEMKRSRLFGQSYEDVILDQQQIFFEKRLRPMLLLLAAALASALAYFMAFSPLETGLNVYGGVLHGVLFGLRAAIAFVCARYVIGLAEPLKQYRILTLGGLQFYQSLLCLLLGASIFSLFPDLAMLGRPVAMAAAAIPAAWVLELALRSVWRLYAARPPELPPECPLAVRIKWKAGVATGAEEAVAYQFGHDMRSALRELVSRGALPLGALFIFSMAAGTSFGVVPTGSIGFLEIFGRLSPKILEPGPYLKPPWPCSTVRLLDTGRVYSVEVGTRLSPNLRRLIWSDEAHDQTSLLLVGDFREDRGKDHPFELLAMHAVLQYAVSASAPRDFVYGHKDTPALIRQEAERQLAISALSVGSGDILSGDRGPFERKVAARIQERLDAIRAGVRVVSFKIPQVHPPKNTVDSFEAAIGARYQKERLVIESQAVELSLAARQSEEEKAILAEAVSSVAGIKSDAWADLAYFEKVRDLENIPGSVFLERRTLEALADSLKNMRKIFLLTETRRDVYDLDLEESLDPDFQDIILKAKEKL